MDTGEPAGTGTPPMYFPDAAGKPDGFDYRVARWIATAVGVPDVTIVHGKYSALPGMLADARTVDVVISGYTADDSPGISWSDGYLDFGLCMVVKRDSTIHSVADLGGATVGIFDDDAAAAAVQMMVVGMTGLVRMEDGYWDALEAGKFSAFIYDFPYTVAELRDWYDENPSKRDHFRIAQYNLTESHYSVGVRTGEPDLLGAVNQGIQRFLTSEEYGAAIKTYLSGGSKVTVTDASKKTYVVVAGDTLSKIAAQKLGSADRWRELWALNKERFGNPNIIEVGDLVVLPP